MAACRLFTSAGQNCCSTDCIMDDKKNKKKQKKKIIYVWYTYVYGDSVYLYSFPNTCLNFIPFPWGIRYFFIVASAPLYVSLLSRTQTHTYTRTFTKHVICLHNAPARTHTYLCTSHVSRHKCIFRNARTVYFRSALTLCKISENKCAHMSGT